MSSKEPPQTVTMVANGHPEAVSSAQICNALGAGPVPFAPGHPGGPENPPPVGR